MNKYIKMEERRRNLVSKYMKKLKLEENKSNSQHKDKSISKSPKASYARKSRMSTDEIPNIYTNQNSQRFNSNLRSPYLTPRRSERHSRHNSRKDLEEVKGSKNASPSSRKSPSSKR